MLDKEDKIWLDGMVERIERTRNSASFHTPFLSERRRKLLEPILQKRNISYQSLPSLEACEKRVLVLGGEEGVIVSYRFANLGFRHQDVLGKLFSLGIKEDTFGDIFVEQDYLYFSVLSTIASLVEFEFQTLCGKKITLERILSFPLQEEHFHFRTISVSSLRVDAVVSRIIGKSRAMISLMITEKQVLLNGKLLLKKERTLGEGDVLSIRHFGKYRLGKLVAKTKKGAIVLEVKEYC